MGFSCFIHRVFVVSLLTVVVSASYGADSGAPSAGASVHEEFLSSRPALSVIARAPDFALIDVAGQKVRLSEQRGRVVLLAFIFTSCNMVCPLISQQMAALQTQLKKAGLLPNKVSMISVTVDPKTDTAEVLAQYAKSYGADPNGWRFLREEPERLKKVLKSYDEWTKQLPAGEIDHPARVYLIDQKGNLREVYSLSFFDAKQAYLDIQALMHEKK